MRYVIRCLFSYLTAVGIGFYLDLRGYTAAAGEVRLIYGVLGLIMSAAFTWTYFRAKREFKRTVANIEHIMASDDFSPYEKWQALQKIPGTKVSVRRMDTPEEPEAKKNE